MHHRDQAGADIDHCTERRHRQLSGGGPFGRGITLVELLVTLAIIALLVALTIGAVRGAREAARAAKCGSNLHQLAAACNAYSVTYRVIPWRQAEPNLAIALDMHPELWSCPANDGVDMVSIDSYFYPAYAVTMRGTNNDPRVWWKHQSRMYEENPRLPLIMDLAPWHGNRGAATRAMGYNHIEESSGYRNVAGYDAAVTRDYSHNFEIVAVEPGGR